ncbi:MAG TPA: Asp-tRNA(Asn)/Glu-tRNA(Gln) amidotransferase subunit GatC [Patescibacteria group bacterium]
MKINVSALAKLANLTLSDKQLKDLEESIPGVVEYMDEVKNLDVDSIPETTRVTEEKNVLREDEVRESLSQEEALKNAKQTYKGFFVVPNVFGGKK